MDTDLEALATALYVTVDDLLIAYPHLAPPRPRVGLVARTSDAEIITLAVMQALLGYTSEARWLRRVGLSAYSSVSVMMASASFLSAGVDAPSAIKPS